MSRGKIISIVGYPSEGKTTAAICLAAREANAGRPSLYFSLDAGPKSFKGRLIRSMNSSMAAEKIFADFTAGIDVETLLSRVDAAIKDKGIRNVFIDYGELVDYNIDTPFEERQESLFSHIREFTLKNDVDFYVVCQASRKWRRREAEWYTIKALPSEPAIKYSDRIYFVKPGVDAPELMLVSDQLGAS